MKTSMLCAVALAIPTLAPNLALSETTVVPTAELPHQMAYDVAKLTPLALSAEGTPAVIQLSVANGVEVPPHATESGFRLITVISGDLYWGDGETADAASETVYGPGSVLMLPAGAPHWLAARNGDLVLQLVVLDDEVPVPAIMEVMQ